MAAKLPNEADILLTATLDEIAWFLNLRGTDIEYNPVFFSYLLFFPSKTEGEPSRANLYTKIEKTQESDVA